MPLDLDMMMHQFVALKEKVEKMWEHLGLDKQEQEPLGSDPRTWSPDPNIDPQHEVETGEAEEDDSDEHDEPHHGRAPRKKR